ncbi:MAB_1171c family putative transporter [Actinocrispum wychmicini]|uniref:DUF6545 domain-containing protein n=1 Tax=Actinocrispum wychmicini TaxID=1213861 RepID=A0A4R2K0T2_9PSEU|nr:MAB_1171c family putative transporter [Actinocrispum wychmicini]TCO65894.1 hypothetical protein EV192_1011686 [Actinocrispum wychmicini]
MTSTYDVVFLTGAIIGTLATTFKLSRLYRYGGHPRSWALTITLAYATGTAFMSAPSFTTWFDTWTGVGNFSTLLEVWFECGFACGAISLVTYWRFAAKRACQLVWRFSRIFFAVIVLLTALFLMSDVRGSDKLAFTTQFGTQPTVAAFVLVYLIPTTIAVAASTRGCGRAAKDPDIANVPWLRRVLRCLQVGVMFALLHLLGQFFALASVWFEWQYVEWVPPVMSGLSVLGFVPGAIAAVLPGVERLRPQLGLCAERWHVFTLLRPLHRALRFVNPEVVFVAKGKKFSPHHRVRRQMLELSEWRWALAPRFDPTVRATAERIGVGCGLSGDELLATVEAAQLKAAIHAGRESDTVMVEATTDGSGLDSEYAWWVAVAKAFRDSPVVTAALAQPRRFSVTPGR